jgi:uncharacterized membrane protein YhaH (DUF805 family)
MNRTYWIYLFTSFHGRIAREPFWIAVAILTAAEIVTQWLAYQIQGETLSAILDLAYTYPEFAIAVKRSNDRNLTPWVVALFFAINAALDLFTLLYGALDADSPINNFVLIPFALLAVILIAELGFRRGTEGPNRFGPDPLSGPPTTPDIFR